MRLPVATGSTARRMLRFVLLLWMASVSASSYAVTNYTITLANPEQHLVEVQIILPGGASAAGVAASGLERVVSSA